MTIAECSGEDVSNGDLVFNLPQPRVREGGGLWERIRELEVLLASVKESKKKEKGQ